MKETPINIYLAGPDVFRPDAKEYGKMLCQLCEKHGAVGLYPLDSEIPVPSSETIPSEVMSRKIFMAREIFEANQALIDKSDAVVANLNPFRGPSADAGTIWETGYACGRNIPVIGYTEETRSYFERAGESTQYQPVGWLIESFDLTDNLMIHCSLGGLFKTAEEAIVEAVCAVCLARKYRSTPR
jgi:nucleoside 2-deoxyribosyltransferase